MIKKILKIICKIFPFLEPYLFKFIRKQHYEYTPYFHKSEVDFELQKFRDVTVRNYCKNKGIALIEIPYTMTNEEVCDLLKKEIIND